MKNKKNVITIVIALLVLSLGFYFNSESFIKRNIFGTYTAKFQSSPFIVITDYKDGELITKVLAENVSEENLSLIEFYAPDTRLIRVIYTDDKKFATRYVDFDCSDLYLSGSAFSCIKKTEMSKKEVRNLKVKDIEVKKIILK